MQGAPKRQVNAEDMLAELKRVLESSTRAPDAPPPSASTAPKSSSQAGRIGDRKLTGEATVPRRRTPRSDGGPTFKSRPGPVSEAGN